MKFGMNSKPLKTNPLYSIQFSPSSNNDMGGDLRTSEVGANDGILKFCVALEHQRIYDFCSRFFFSIIKNNMAADRILILAFGFI
jgi:hypothetical protein